MATALLVAPDQRRLGAEDAPPPPSSAPAPSPASSISRTSGLCTRKLVKTCLSEDRHRHQRVLSLFAATHTRGDLKLRPPPLSRIASPTAFSCNTNPRAASGSFRPSPRPPPQFPLDMLSLLFLITAAPHRSLPSSSPAAAIARADVGPIQRHGCQLGCRRNRTIIKKLHDIHVRLLRGPGGGGRNLLSSIRKEAVFDVVACNSMLTALLRKGLAQQARRLFDEMPQRTISTWSTLMSGYLRNGLFQETLSLFGELQRTTTPELHPNPCCLVSLLGACAGLGALEQGEWAHETLIRTHREAVDNNPIILNAIIHMYCKCGRLDKALIAFEASPTRALSSWNAIIGALAIHGRCPEAVQLFSQLEPVHGLKPDAVTFVAVLTACSHAGMVDEARRIFASMSERHGVEPAVEHYGCMVDALARAGHLQAAEDLIRGMTTPLRPDAAVWGALLAGSRSHGDVERAARAAAEILILDSADGGGYLLLANALAGSGGFGDSAAVRAAVKEKRVRNKPGCSMIEVMAWCMSS
ncbi:unnamed protein product [Spirodela intermedia]|uniref:Uncharacterized protein n=1 Tax=Spirodela intermedia TaxID=51605 RepID=A0A7I8J5J8_SPIIN|nr:unnamed protein product [Spirodela intermedia]CAA6665300.1 unnamed protein product [Spirodela intermedia]